LKIPNAVKAALITVGTAIISKGVDFINQNEMWEGLICIIIGFILIVSAAYLQEKQATEKAVEKVMQILNQRQLLNIGATFGTSHWDYYVAYYPLNTLWSVLYSSSSSSSTKQ